MLHHSSFALKKKIKTVCVIGPECTGKTALSKFLAEHYKVPWVQEYARAYLGKLGRKYHESDLLKIGHGQIRMEDEWKQDADRLLICDTNLLVIKIWSEFKYGKVEPEIELIHAQRTYDLYLLTYIDVPWEEDPQREHPQQREELWQRYYNLVGASQVPVVEIRGTRPEREALAVQAIDRLLIA
jgi:NadR type nicotinamide-nucleotide adenylyltransferase